MKQLNKFVPEFLLCAAMMIIGVAVAIGQTKESSQKPQSRTASQSTRPAASNRGATVFEQNCSRCHNTPQGFPPSVSGTIAMHMRVRANLSDEDYKALRQFLNP